MQVCESTRHHSVCINTPAHVKYDMLPRADNECRPDQQTIATQSSRLISSWSAGHRHNTAARLHNSCLLQQGADCEPAPHVTSQRRHAMDRTGCGSKPSPYTLLQRSSACRQIQLHAKASCRTQKHSALAVAQDEQQHIHQAAAASGSSVLRKQVNLRPSLAKCAAMRQPRRSA